MAGFGENAIEAVRQRADIVEVIGAHVRLRRAGRNLVGLCPFHNEKTPSFSVNPERGFFHCFGCGAAGSVFNFVMKVEALTFPEAVRSLARRYGVNLPEAGESGPQGAERKARAQVNQLASEFFFHVLWNTREGAVAREYLKARAVAPETARAFILGFAPARGASLAEALKRRGLMEAALKLGLVKRDQAGVYDLFRARVMFPIRDAEGRVLAFGARVLDSTMPKYLNSPESPIYSKARTLYGLHEARRAIAAADRAIVVEGYFDVIALWQAGYKETVASCGTSLTVDQLRVLRRYTKNVMACFDGDEAGRKASLRALAVFLQAGLLGRAIFIPPGFDPDTVVRERGAAAFGEMVEGAEQLLDYFFRVHRERTLDSPQAKAEVGAALSEMLAAISDPYLRDVVRQKAVSFLHFREDTIWSSVKGKERTSERAPASLPHNQTRKYWSEAQLGLVALALLHPELRSELRARCPASHFDDRRLAGIFDRACALGELDAMPEALIGSELSAAEQTRLAEIAGQPEVSALADEYAEALARRRERYEIERLKDATAAPAGEGGTLADNVAAAQALIALKRRRDKRRRGADPGDSP